MLGINATPESVARIEEDLGLDEPPLEQLGTFFVKAFTLDFGESIVKQTSVREVIADRIPPSIYLILASVFVALVIAVPLGIMRPRFSAIWLLPVVLWLSSRSDNGDGLEALLPAVVVGTLVLLLLASSREMPRSVAESA